MGTHPRDFSKATNLRRRQVLAFRDVAALKRAKIAKIWDALRSSCDFSVKRGRARRRELFGDDFHETHIFYLT